MSPNQYLTDMRAEVAALRAVVARVEVLADEFDAAMWRGAARELRDALSGDLPFGSERVSTDSDPAATERQGEAGRAGGHV